MFGYFYYKIKFIIIFNIKFFIEHKDYLKLLQVIINVKLKNNYTLFPDKTKHVKFYPKFIFYS